ncbi:MAG: DNA/RNA nuclease SfsA [Candidatus Bathyarchaeota archaeon]|nr:DNA/RNA nuclease SfsA [Candidatus Bathyarchaeota archaeon]
MKHPSTPIPATLLRRPNRFLGVVDLEGEHVECFIPNPGRMHELMVPGTRVHLINKPGDHRKTSYDLTLIEYNDTLVSIDSRLPNYMLREAINQGKLPEFKDYKVERTEPSFHDSRLDLKLSNGTNQILLEAKSCTLVEEGLALFPDAPTKRGARHMNTLIKALEHGRAAVCFIIQRDDASEWRPHVEMDPLFTENLRKAVENGVEAYAYTCNITLEGTTIGRRVPVNLEKQPVELKAP